MKEIEAIINSRPLTVLPDSPLSPEALTPGHFLNGCSPLVLPSGSIRAAGEKDDKLTKIWRSREKLFNDFWNRWKNEYILLLRSAHLKGGSQCSKLVVGDIVIIHEPNLDRAKWKLGRVEEIVVGRDQVARACSVRTQNGVLLRTFQHLYKLM